MGQQRPTALYRAEEVRELDRKAIVGRGIPGYTLMCRAAAATLEALRQRWPKAQRVVVLCGVGNNGGDGYALARLGHAEKLDARVLFLGDPDKLTGDARQAREDCLAAGVSVASYTPAPLSSADIIVDALLGTGLQRAVTGEWAQAIGAVNECSAPVVSIDIPSGLDADTGRIHGVGVRATLTVTYIGLKRGLFTAQARAYCGDIRFDSLAVPADIYPEVPSTARRYAGEDIEWLLPPRERDAHKGDCGHVLVVGGDHGMGGAARMAAESAARVGAGLVSVATRHEHAAAQAAIRPEIMFRGVEDSHEFSVAARRATAIAVGPGLGQGAWGQLMWKQVLGHSGVKVVDADALNLLAAQTRRSEDWILTPHPGEAGRLLGVSAAEVEEDRFAAVEALQTRYGGVCILKGAGTLVLGSDGCVTVCEGGNPGMGSGGMGDLLSGVLVGLLAQGLRLEDSARLGVFLHNAAADRVAGRGERGMLATDLLPELRRLVNGL
jgi:NAD(P)H-hydrate epimerase